MDLDVLASRLEGVKRVGSGFEALCPTHEDQNPSLSVNLGTKGIVMHCHTGCRTDEIAAALEINLRDLFYHQSPEDTSHDRTVLALELRSQMARIRPPNPWEGHLPSLSEVMRISFYRNDSDVGARRMAISGSTHSLLHSLEFSVAWKMWHVVADGPLWVYLRAWWWPRGINDWDEVKREAMTHMHKTWRERDRWMRQ